MFDPVETARPEVSVILTSHNGASKLRTTLPAVFAAMKEIVSSELILVDNASTDTTALSLVEFGHQTDARVVSETRKGKSFGLNRGIDSARGRLLVFIDDDVRPTNTWLTAFFDASARFPDANVFAGQVRPDWPYAPSGWLKYLTDIGLSYGCTPLDRTEGPCHYSQAKGANFMVRRSALENGIKFNEHAFNYGAPGGTGGEDVQFIYDVLRGGESLMFIPDATVFHAINLREMRLEEVLRRYRRIGRTRAGRLLSMGKGHQLPNFSKVLTKALKSIASAATLNLNDAAKQAVGAATCYGEWLERRSMKAKRRADVST